MKKSLQLIPKMVWKGSMITICYFLFAACMQHDESLTPVDSQMDLLSAADLDAASSMGAESKRTFTAHLSGGNEVPANDSQGQGQVIFKLSKDGTELQYKLIVANIENVTQAHIHCGEAGVNGAVVVFLFGFVPTGVNVNGVLAEGTITSANIIPRADGPNCSGGLQTWDDLIGRLRTGRAYVNVHTVAKPPGEIRGQIQ